nr:ROK family protein [Luteococcus japonicus]
MRWPRNCPRRWTTPPTKQHPCADALGRGIAGLVTLLDPERVVIGGGFADPSSPWWQRMEATLRAQVIDALADVELLPARLGAQAAILGAARAAMTMNHKSR